MSASEYWKIRFGEHSDHHSTQNTQISEDFIKKNYYDDLFQSTNKILEVGCGTGELSKMLSDKYDKEVIGLDLSEEAILFANHNYGSDKLKYYAVDCLNESISHKIGDDFDIAICSNTLEHFKNPYILIDKILKVSKVLIILVPYKQPLKDGYSDEGGAGHVFMFDEESFSNYILIDPKSIIKDLLLTEFC